MKGWNDTWSCGEALRPTWRAGSAGTSVPVWLAPSPADLPPPLHERLHAAAAQLGLPEGLIAAVAIALFLDGEGL